jgi:hypothetical protein
MRDITSPRFAFVKTSLIEKLLAREPQHLGEGRRCDPESLPLERFQKRCNQRAEPFAFCP